MSPWLITVLEWTATALSLVGAWLLATHSRFSRIGWFAFLAANFASIAFAIGIERHGLLLQQIGFTGSSLLGIARTRIRPSTGAPK